jgi:hypothetical protein
VLDGLLTIQEVITEVQRSIPGGWNWNVEAVGNVFHIVFPSRVELL